MKPIPATSRAASGVSRRAVLGAGAALGGVGLAGSWSVSGSGSESGTTTDPVQALVAGSLLPLVSEVPGASVEAHGSVAVSRFVRDGMRDPDVVALADPRLFDGIADRPTLFATNALVVATHPDSPHADAVADDWANAVQRPSLTLGRTDPNIDPLGYRTVLAFRLAERLGITSSTPLDESLVAPETQLMRGLESGAAYDAVVCYRSMAVEHDLPFVDLPPEIDFSDPAHAERYGSVSVTVDGRRLRGTPIRYGVAGLTERGREWVTDLTSGVERLRDHGFTVPTTYPRALDAGDEMVRSGST